jgi:hypothetical protein
MPGGTLTLAVGIYALLIAGLSVFAALAKSSLTDAKLQGVLHALQSIAAERKELAKAGDSEKVSRNFASAETAKTQQLAKDLLDTAAKMEVSPQNKAARDNATALATQIVAERPGRSQ